MALHIAALSLPSSSSSRCASWLQVESEHETSRGGWVRVRSYSQKICGTREERKHFMDGEEWLPGNQFYNETSTNQITLKFSAGRQRENLGFTVVVTPLSLACPGASYGFDGEQFWCGGPGEEGYCVDSGLVCDGRVNCMLPGREAQDERSVFCRKLGGREQGRKGGREAEAFTVQHTMSINLPLLPLFGLAGLVGYGEGRVGGVCGGLGNGGW